MTPPRSFPLAAALLAVASLLAATGCLRQTAGAAAVSTGAHPMNLVERPEPPVVETDRPSGVFTLDGEPLCFAGTNNYYLIYKSHKMVDDVLETTKSMGLKVIRVWGYLDRGSLDGTVRNVDGAGEKGGVYFQAWDPATKRPVYNDGATGMEHLDYVLDKAKKLDLKVIVVLTNNWKDFGGMDQYLVWYGLKEHQLFYTDPTVGQAYKDWVAHVVGRKNSISGVLYKDDPTVFSWELGNEPRCTNSWEFDNASACKASMITHWVDQMSTYIKSIDPNHLIAVGDEGFFANGADRSYDGAEGVDHDSFLASPHVDFGTFHLYPESWGHRTSWASKWIEDHIEAARRAGKPTILEEYGTMARRDPQLVITDDARRRKTYARWHDIIQKEGGNAAFFWMLAGIDDESEAIRGMYPDYDHFELYSTDFVGGMIKTFASAMVSDGRACTLYRKFAAPGTLKKSAFVSTAPPPARAPQADRADFSDPSASLEPSAADGPSAVAN